MEEILKTQLYIENKGEVQTFLYDNVLLNDLAVSEIKFGDSLEFVDNTAVASFEASDFSPEVLVESNVFDLAVGLQCPHVLERVMYKNHSSFQGLTE